MLYLKERDMGKIKQIVPFCKCVFIWYRTMYWYKRCTNPLKLSILELMLVGTHMCLKSIGWWIPILPKFKTDKIDPTELLNRVRVAAHVERNKLDHF